MTDNSERDDRDRMLALLPIQTKAKSAIEEVVADAYALGLSEGENLREQTILNPEYLQGLHGNVAKMLADNGCRPEALDQLADNLMDLFALYVAEIETEPFG